MKKAYLGAIVAGIIAVASGASTYAVECPAGSLKAGDTVSSLAECNIQEDDSLIPTITIIIDVILGVLGLVAVIFIILGGVTYTTSAGDPGKVKKAKDTILYGIIGLVVALLAFAVVNFVLTSVFGN